MTADLAARLALLAGTGTPVAIKAGPVVYGASGTLRVRSVHSNGVVTLLDAKGTRPIPVRLASVESVTEFPIPAPKAGVR